MKYFNSNVMALVAVALLSFVLNVFGQSPSPSINNTVQQGPQGGVIATPTPSPSPSPSPSPTVSPSPIVSPSPLVSPSAAAVSLQVRQDATFGAFVADAAGKSLYLFMTDTQNQSSCSGNCAAVWPPLMVQAGQSPTAGPGVNQALIGTTSRSDGSTQVTYAGHPLYYYALDQNAGDAFGQGLSSFGALWWLVDSNGNAIMGPAAMSSPTPSPTPSPAPSADGATNTNASGQ